MTRAPFVMGKADSAFSRAAKIEDTTIGWRFVNPLMKAKYGIDSMPETAENVAANSASARADQDAFALAQPAALGRGPMPPASSRTRSSPVTLPQKKGEPRCSTPTSTRVRTPPRDAGQAQGRGHVRTAPSPPATPRASTTAPARCCSPPRPRRPSYGLKPRARVVGHGRGRPGAAHHGLRPVAGLQKVLALTGLTHGPDGRDRTERSLCRAGPGRDCATSAWRTTRRTSIRTAAPLRSATRWAPPARAW